MNGKFLSHSILAATLILVSMAVPPAEAKAKKYTVKCVSKKHLFLSGCSKPSTKPDFQGGGGGGGGGNGGGGGRTGSDRRLKHDLQFVGTTIYGLPVYDFKYNGQQGTYEGVMAQDVLKVKPEAVSIAADGFYRVNYRMLGLNLKRIR